MYLFTKYFKVVCPTPGAPPFRPPIPNGSPNTFVNLMTSCWAENPRERPPFSKITEILKHLAQS